MSEYPVKMLFMTGLSRHGTPIIVDVLGENARIPGGLYIRYPAGGTDTTGKDFLFDLPDEMVALQSERDELRAKVADLEADNLHQRERRNAARDCINKMKDEISQLRPRVAEPVAFAVYWGQGDVELYEAPLPAFGGDPEAVTPLYTRPPSAGVPVGEIVTKPFVDVKFFENTEFGTALPEGTKLYTQPQPAHQGSVTEEAVENWRHDSEELEALHANFDDAGTPRAAQGGEVYSAWGRALRFAAQQGSVPENWKLVPIVPTKSMQDAWDTAPTNECADQEFIDAYQAMLDAAPQPPQEGDQ